MNHEGLAELGWLGSQWVNGKNGYKHWERLTPAEQSELKNTYAALPPEEKAYLRNVVIAAIDAFQSAVLV